MPGKLVYHQLRENKAFAEGQDAATAGALEATNPHVSGSSTYTAWAAGWADGGTLACDVFAGGAACSSPPVVVAVDADTLSIEEAADDDLTVTVTIANAPRVGYRVNAVSEDTDICTVDAAVKVTDADGEVVFTITGVAAGEADVTVGYGGTETVCTVTVTAP